MLSRLKITLVAVVVVALACGSNGSPTAQDIDRDRLRERLADVDRFKLFNGCAGMDLLLFVAPENPRLHTAAETLAESRLRAARLYRRPLTIRETLGVSINTVRDGARGPFHISVQFFKMVTDVTGISSRAATWDSGNTGAGDDDYILSILSRLLDQFLVEYLRVNDAACDDSPAER